MAAGRAEVHRPQIFVMLVARAKLPAQIPRGEQTGLASQPVVHQSGLAIGRSQLGFGLRRPGSRRAFIRSGKAGRAENHHAGHNQLVREALHG